jgi:hypothetical protein
MPTLTVANAPLPQFAYVRFLLDYANVQYDIKVEKVDIKGMYGGELPVSS